MLLIFNHNFNWIIIEDLKFFFKVQYFYYLAFVNKISKKNKFLMKKDKFDLFLVILWIFEVICLFKKALLNSNKNLKPIKKQNNNWQNNETCFNP